MVCIKLILSAKIVIQTMFSFKFPKSHLFHGETGEILATTDFYFASSMKKIDRINIFFAKFLSFMAIILTHFHCEKVSPCPKFLNVLWYEESDNSVQLKTIHLIR